MLSLFVSLWLSAAVPSPGWFYISRLQLTYPGAYSYMIDGPFKSKSDCEAVREATIEFSEQVGVKFESQPCSERKES